MENKIDDRVEFIAYAQKLALDGYVPSVTFWEMLADWFLSKRAAELREIESEIEKEFYRNIPDDDGNNEQFIMKKSVLSLLASRMK